MDILTTFLGILDDMIPSFTILLDDFRKNITENKYLSTVNVILAIKLIMYIITFAQMVYYLFYKNQKTYTSSTLLKLLLTVVNIFIVLFIMLDVKRFILK